MKIKNSILDAIGCTPLVKINNLSDTVANVYAKVEFFNPGGSIKDRVAYALIKNAQDKGIISPQITTIIEPTSGNTGIGLAMVCAVLGYKLILVMPDNMSKERTDILKAYGASLVLTPANLGVAQSVKKAYELSQDIENSFLPSQFDNPDNIQAHYLTTASEIYNDLNGQVDVVIAGIGTGGTISGIGKKLKENNKDVSIVGFEPFSSPLISKGIADSHKIQGIGANFIPENYKAEFVDEIYTVTNEEAYFYTKFLAQKEGILAGISSGGALCVAHQLAKREENQNKNIVAILPDTGARYLSCSVY